MVGDCGAADVRDARNEGIVRDDRPVWTDVERGHRIGDERERKPLEDLREDRVPEADGRDSDTDAERDDPDVGVESGEQLGGVGHSTQVGPDVDRVGDEERNRGDQQYRPGKLVS